MRKSLWIMLAALVVAIGAPNAHGDSVTFDVSGTLVPSTGSATCGAGGCTVGGTIVIDPTTGNIISENVTFSGESPMVGPFTVSGGVSAIIGGVELLISDSKGVPLEMLFDTPTTGSLVGFTGGLFSTVLIGDEFGTSWASSTGAPVGGLTEAAPAVPEPPAVALMLLGLGLVYVMRKRIGQGLPQAN